jgi:hypothetical protein
MTEARSRKMQKNSFFELRSMGVIRSESKERSKAPKQGSGSDVWTSC